MQELLLINPRKRATRRKSTKAASPAQKRARAAFAAAARARAGTKRKAKRRSTSSAITVMSNPRKRRTHRKHHAVASRRRHNPISLKGGMAKPLAMLTPALMGALGATTVNTILGKLPLPAAAMTGKMRYVTQGVAAIALAMIAKKVGVKGAMAAQMAEGSLTVTLHQAIVDVAGSAGMNLSGMGYYLPGMRAPAVPSTSANAGQMAMNGMGKYVSGPGSRGMAGVSAITRGKGGFGF